jgi:processive 1,2-diacylglycerol beta-glucosyltransferase
MKQLHRPRILLLSASVGSGHNRAAQAIQLALQKLRPDAIVEYVDVLDDTNRAFRRMYGKGYFGLVDRAPHVIGYLYDRLDQPVKSPRVDRMRLSLSMLNLQRLADRLTHHHWDMAICTHFLPAEITATLRLAGKINFPQAIVTTDFDTHRLWVNPPCAKYFTAAKEGAIHLTAWGVPSADISVTGIPIHPSFAEFKPQAEARRAHGIANGRPVILQLSGGAGFGPVEKVHRALLDVQTPLTIVTVAGRNAKLRDDLNRIACPPQHVRQILGYTEQMDELMAAADVVVSKPGGLTASESLARGAAMVIIDPIPGQETRNSDYLLENGAAIKVNNLASLPFKLSALLGERGRLEQLRGNAKRVARPHAAFDVASQCLEMIGPLPSFQEPQNAEILAQ